MVHVLEDKQLQRTMSRGGRGGHYRGRPRGPNLPFEVDPELAEAVDRAEEEGGSSDDDFQKDLFPVITVLIEAKFERSLNLS